MKDWVNVDFWVNINEFDNFREISDHFACGRNPTNTEAQGCRKIHKKIRTPGAHTIEGSEWALDIDGGSEKLMLRLTIQPKY